MTDSSWTGECLLQARPEKISPRDKEKFDPYRYRYGMVDRGGTGQYLFGARFYDPNQGVRTQQDSLDAPLDPVNANRYACAGGDPINNYDPAGLKAGEVGLQGSLIGCVGIGVTFDDEDHVSLDLFYGGGSGFGLTGNVGMKTGGAAEHGESSTTGSCGAAYGGVSMELLAAVKSRRN